MEKVKEKIKLGTTKRQVNKDKVYYLEAPNEVNNLLGRYLGRYDSFFRRISYNGGGDLVNYGLNTFVRDLYMVSEQVVYSDRFGRYRSIISKKVGKVIFNSDLFITSEGILLFYNKNNGDIYATLDCKVGYLFNVSSFGDYSLPEEDLSIVEINSINKKTFIKVSAKSTTYQECYLLNFSFNLYESYGTQITVYAVKTDDDYLSYKSITTAETLSTIIDKNNSVKKLRILNTDFKGDPSNLFDLYGLYNSNKEKVSPDYSIYHHKIDYNGEIGICDSINSFVKSITIAKPLITTKKSLFKKQTNNTVRKTITKQDRFNTLYTSTNISDALYEIISACNNIAVASTEGVIVIFNKQYNDIHMTISLDGIMWKDYNISDIFKDIKDKIKDKIISIEFTCKNGRDILTILTVDNKNNINTTICEIIVDFKFNFWDLYGSPVEASFTLME